MPISEKERLFWDKIVRFRQTLLSVSGRKYLDNINPHTGAYEPGRPEIEAKIDALESVMDDFEDVFGNTFLDWDRNPED